MKKKEKILYIYLLLLPFVDLITSIATWENWPSIGLLYKGILLLYAVYYLLWQAKDKKRNRFIVGFIFLYFVANTFYWYFMDKSVLLLEIIHFIKVFYFPICLLFFASYESKYFDKKLIVILSCFFLMFYLLPYPFHLGHNINEIYPNKNLYLSYFYVGNELINVFLILVPVAILYFIENRQKYMVLYLLCVLFMLLLLGTKAMYIGVLIIIGYFLVHFRQFLFIQFKKYWAIFLSLFVVMVVFLVFWLPQSEFYRNMKTSLDFYEIKSFRELLTFENIDNIIYSNRLDFLKNIHDEYRKSDITTKFMGLGRTKITNVKDIEIDLFDIFYSIGIIGFLVYLIVMIYVFFRLNLFGIYKFLFILLFVISMVTGHVLISPMTSTYLSLIGGISYNERREENETLDKKSIKKT